MERLPDTPWHIGFTKKKESDPRRHKSKCIHYRSGNCNYGKLAVYGKICPGSAHCKYYAENKTQQNLVRLKTETIEEQQLRIKEQKNNSNSQDVKNNNKTKANRSIYDNSRRRYLLYDMDYKEEVEYIVVASNKKTDSTNGVISCDSPVGKALICHKVGEIVSIHLPSGITLNYKILAFAFVKKEKNKKVK